MLWTNSRRREENLDLNTKWGPSSTMVGVQDNADQLDVFARPREETGRKRPDSEKEREVKSAKEECSIRKRRDDCVDSASDEPTDECARTGREAKS